MKILFVPTTEGFGHVSRAKAIIDECTRQGIEYTVLTDQIRAKFLLENGILPSSIHSSFYGIKYVYHKNK